MLDLTNTNIYDPVTNGVLVFFLGMLFVLIVYHVGLFWQNRNRLYLLYTLYLSCLFLAQAAFLRESFIYEALTPIRAFIINLRTFFTEMYLVLYLIFAYEFLRVKDQFPSWFRSMKIFVFGLICYSIITTILQLTIVDPLFIEKFYLPFTILATLFGLASYRPFFRSRSPVKFYLIFGSMAFLVGSWFSLGVYMYYGGENYEQNPLYSAMYLGYTLEVLLFALGLGQLQRNIADEKEQSQTELIIQLKENDHLKDELKVQLEKNLRQLQNDFQQERLKLIEEQHNLEKAELKLTALRSQMNPHFIFNSLNSIKLFIIGNENKNAVNYLNKFSKLIRKILASTREKEVTLKEELETMKLYVSIENMRLENTINFSVEYDPNLVLSSFRIPSLILQPFIENAIWHGLSTKEGDKKLLISIKEENSVLTIGIRDNGIGRHRAKQLKKNKMHKKKSLGINLSRERLAYFFARKDQKGNIEIKDLKDALNKSVGTEVILRLPINKRIGHIFS